MPDHIVLAYSGGLDTSVAVHWLKNTYDADVTAVLVDLGQPDADLAAAEARAIANGATGCVVIDAKDDFADTYLAPAIKANAMYEGAYPLGTALNRPLIAKALAEAAAQVGADAVAHGCTGKGNDQVRIEAGIAALAPHLECLAPQRDSPMDRPAAIKYAEDNDLELPELKSSPFSIDDNLWTRSVEGGVLEDPATPVPEEAYEWTVNPKEAPDDGQVVTIGFEAGLPVSLDGTELPLSELVAELNGIAGSHGIGRIDHVESRLVGIKSREVYEAPAALTVLAAKTALETLTLTRDEIKLKATMEQEFAGLTYDGLWYAPVMDAVQAFIDTVQANVTGTVSIELYKGTITVVSRTSPVSLYDDELATYGADDSFDHAAAKGFIDIWSLPLATATNARATDQPQPAPPNKVVQ